MTTPSKRYHELVELYAQAHREGIIYKRQVDGQLVRMTPAQTFPGIGVLALFRELDLLFQARKIKTVLDYGSGKGLPYLRPTLDRNNNTVPRLNEFWNVDVTCYDPAVPGLADLPNKKFDAVICCAVLEHLPEEDLDWLLDDILQRADRLVFLAVDCYIASSLLPNGDNTHETIRAPAWWAALVKRAYDRNPGVPIVLACNDRPVTVISRKHRFYYFGALT